MLFPFFQSRNRSRIPSPKRLRLTFEPLEAREMLNGTSLEAANDPDIAKQWGLNSVNIAEAWKYSDGTGVVVAVLDSGTTLSHPDLQSQFWHNPGEIDGDGIDNDGNGFIDDIFGWNFVDDSNDLTDTDGHGTHVAGIIGAEANNGSGGSGVAPGVQLLTVKVISGSTGSTSCIAAGLNYIIGLKHSGVNIAVATMSLGYYDADDAVAQAVRDAGAAGITIVCSAGNNSNNNDTKAHYPSEYSTFDNVLAVASVSQNGQFAANSNYGLQSVNLAAPGVSIYSTTKDGSFGNMSGTSMAAPFVSGAAAIIAASNPALTPKQIKEKVLGAVYHTAALNGKVSSGGVLNIGAVFAPPVPEGQTPLKQVNLPRLSIENNAVRIRWSAVAGAAGYRIDRSTDAGEWTTLSEEPSGTTEYFDDITEYNVSCSYRITALSSDGTFNAVPSKIKSIITPPKPPEDVSIVSQTDKTITLSWSASPNVLRYIIERRRGERWSSVASTRDTQIVLRRLTPETEYELRVVAVGKNGKIIPDTSLLAVTAVLVPAAPPRFTVSASDYDTILLKWNAANRAEEYLVQRYDYKAKTWMDAGMTEELYFIDSHLLPATRYGYAVWAVNVSGKSRSAAKGNATTFSKNINGADVPESFILSKAGSRSLQLTWFYESTKPVLYRIQWASFRVEGTTDDYLWTGQKKVSLLPRKGNSTFTINGLEPETLYYVRIRVETPGLVSDWADVAEFETH
ncbi:MAG: S8 family serine peptidase [Planctomycetaceae bacterium]|nr:S8 family serine peptidase [Planctomycetaceae bacterium]